MLPTKPFRATSGLDAAGEKVINVATGDKTILSDGVNVDFFHLHNTIQPYDSKRGYEEFFAVIYNNRIYYALGDIVSPAGVLNPDVWKPLRVCP